MDQSCSTELKQDSKCENAKTFVRSTNEVPLRSGTPHHHHHHQSQREDLVPYLMFKKPRSLQVFRIHELSLSVLCCAITLVRVLHSPKNSAVQTPAALLTPCLPASDVLLLCQTTVICDWAPIDRAATLSPAEIIAVTSSRLPGSILTPLKPDWYRDTVPQLEAKLSHAKVMAGQINLSKWYFCS